MRTVIAAWLALSCVMGIGCGGGSTTLNQDYSANFVGTWNGSQTTQTGTQSESGLTSQTITQSGANRLSLGALCPGTDAVATVTSASTFSIGSITCPPLSESCGQVTFTLVSGSGQVTQGKLTVTIHGTATGCGQSLTYTSTFTGTRSTGGNGPTAAVAASYLQTSPGTPVTLDATPSSDPAGLALSFAWSVTQQPLGGNAALTGSTTAKPTFTATVAGTYTVQVTVTASDGESATTAVTVVLSYGAFLPTAAVASATVGTTPGTPVTLDATPSSDPGGLPLTFSWTVTQTPTGGDAVLTGAATAQPTFTATVQGAYTVQVRVTASDGPSATAAVTVTVMATGVAIPALAHGVSQARFSRALGRIIMTDGTPAALYVYDPTTATETKVALSLAPQCLSLTRDGLHALVGHNAWVSYVDLVGAKIEKSIPVSMNVGDCVIAGNGWSYLFSTSYSGNSESLQIATGVESATSMIYEGSHGVLSPDGVTMYAVTDGLSPAQIYRYDFSGGAAIEKWGSPYWGDYAMSAPLWISPDGARLFTGSGTAFRTSTVQGQDMLYGGALSGMTGVQSLDVGASEIAAIAAVNQYYYGSSPPTDTAVELYNTDYLGHVNRIILPNWQVGGAAYATHGRYVFYSADGSSKYVIVKADGSSGLLHDTAVLTY